MTEASGLPHEVSSFAHVPANVARLVRWRDCWPERHRAAARRARRVDQKAQSGSHSLISSRASGNSSASMRLRIGLWAAIRDVYRLPGSTQTSGASRPCRRPAHASLPPSSASGVSVAGLVLRLGGWARLARDRSFNRFRRYSHPRRRRHGRWSRNASARARRRAFCDFGLSSAASIPCSTLGPREEQLRSRSHI